MELLIKYGTQVQQETYLTPLLNGEIRSAFCMTEPMVASSDATNIKTKILEDGDEFVVNGMFDAAPISRSNRYLHSAVCAFGATLHFTLIVEWYSTHPYHVNRPKMVGHWIPRP